jgi:hypothetical protein
MAAQGLSGCACLDEDWHAYVMYEAEAAEYETEKPCTKDPLKNLSGISAELYESADPALLKAARREAEYPCKGAAGEGVPQVTWTATIK